VFDFDEIPPQPMTLHCAHCGRVMGDAAGGFGSYNALPLCHPNDDNRPDCYTLVSREHHHIPCDEDICVKDRSERE
jgi:hypothetical protein